MDILEKGHKFITLDALRGVAALTVFEFHFSGVFGASVFPHGYLAVDFFFMLSGFVLGHAYQSRLDRGWPATEFLKARFVRLYPLYLLGLVFGFAQMWHFRRPPPAGVSNSGMVVLLAFGSLLLPVPFSIRGAGSLIFPFDLPTWSLFYEALANILHALLLRRRSLKFLSLLVAFSGLLLAALVVKFRSLDSGFVHGNFFRTLCRVTYAYAAGLVLLRVWKSGRLRMRVSPLVPMVLLVLTFAVRASGIFRPLYDVAASFLIFPMILLLGASTEPASGFKRLFEALGVSSYSIYVLHYPLESFFERVWTHFRRHSPDLDAPWSGIAGLLVIVVFSFCADRFYDLPVRDFLGRKTRGSATTVRVS